jgi:nitrogen-specific signal transduction histidine kinase
MTNFANLAAISINAWQEMRSSAEHIEASVTNRFEMQARRVVHEAGNPLAIIKNYLKIVAQKIPGEANILQEFGILREEIDRVSTILQRLNSMSSAAPVTGIVDINGIIEGMLSLYGSSLFSSCGITIEKNLEPSLPPVSGDRDSIKQILLNIWKNAAEALSAGHRVAVTTKGPATNNGRDFVEITLGDSGPGLPPEVRQRLFQPLEHDRRPGHSGLGLSIVATLVEQLEGVISCQSNAGQGTAFTILLPCSTGTE